MKAERVKLLFYTGASGYEQSGTVWLTDDQVRMWGSLGSEFDATLLALEVDTERRRTAPLPDGMKVVWLPARFEARWPGRLFLRPAEMATVWKHLRAADAFLTFMPEIGGIVPLLLALLAGRRRYMLQISAPSHFRSWKADGAALSLASRLVVNCLGAISTRVFVTGRDLKREFIPQLRSKSVEVVMSTLATDDFHDPAASNGKTVNLLTVARLVRNKRIDVVMRATRTLLDRGIDAHLAVLGEGPLQDDLLRFAHELQLGSHFELVGQVDDPDRLRDHYSDSAMFLLASETEGLSLSVLEAMAAGTPVITTAAGGLRSFLSHGRDAIVISGPDPAAFADAVEKLLADRDAYLRIARTAQEKVKRLSNRSWAQHMERTIRGDIAGRT